MSRKEAVRRGGAGSCVALALALATAVQAQPHPAAIDSTAEPGLAARRARYARPAGQQIAMVPAYVLRAPFWVLNYPLEHWVIHRDPGPATVYARRALGFLQGYHVGLRFQGVGTGSGAGMGAVYSMPRRLTGGVPFSANVAETYNGYDQFGAGFDSLRLGALASSLRFQYTERPQEDFFGIGPHSEKGARSTYQEDEWLLRWIGVMPVSTHWRVLLAAAASRHDIGRGRDRRFPTALEVFPPTTEGLAGRFEFVEFGAGLTFDSRDVPSYARHGSFVTVRVQTADGVDGTTNAYTKYSVEASQYVALPGYRRGLALHLRGAVTDNRGDVDVPVFRLERLGGSHSLRGYPSFRFVDKDALLGNVEYRFPFWSLGLPSGFGVDGAALFDFGATVPNVEDLVQRDFHSDAGIGMRMVSNRGFLARGDVCWGVEGIHLNGSLGVPF